MRILLAQLAPRRGAVSENLDRLDTIVGLGAADLAVFPELFLSGYRVGDRVHSIAFRPGGPELERLSAAARKHRRAIVVGAPLRSPDRPGEVQNAAVLVRPDGATQVQPKRFLPTYGPFEEGSFFTPTSESHTMELGSHRVGLEICYDAFFPEVTRDLALDGAELFVAISAAPVTSRRLFDRVLPARAVENATPLIYVNRVGVEDGVVFGGGSAGWDARGELLVPTEVPFERRESEEAVFVVEVDL
ncbi:MAG: carbon-nitrogen hydrolase family protein, partial [Thermoplasmata archaeon]|nr:carbon-nitrogen hydrolase family protein [Thermoplasmata archaeon]